MSSVKIPFEIEVTHEAICDLVSTAFEGGVDYWTGHVEQTGAIDKKEKGLVFWGQPHLYEDPDFSFEVTFDGVDDEEGDFGTKKLVNLQVLIDGLKLMAEKHPQHFNDFVREEYDATTADVFMQLVLLGDVIYG